MNIFPITGIQSLYDLLESKIPQIVEKSPSSSSAPLGLWFPNHLLQEIKSPSKLNKIMEQNQQQICTLNGFPFGVFHGVKVKEKVYKPDWSERERLVYTCNLVDLASELPLTEGIIPISTVPIGFGTEIKDQVWHNLESLCEYLDKTRQTNSLHFKVLFEPEPGCALDRIHNTVDFLEKLKEKIPGANQYLGICIDTCHCAVMHEDPVEFLEKVEELGFSVDKIQISSALRLAPEKERAHLSKFDEETYLHQTTIKNQEESLHFFPDLKPALRSDLQGETRVHFHIPLHSTPQSPLESTTTLLDAEFFRKAAKNNRILEIETYSFSVLPSSEDTVFKSIVKEIGWLKKQLDNQP